MPARELAELLGVSADVLVSMCRYRAGRFFFLGAREEEGGEWFIPARSIERALCVAELGFLLRPAEAAAVLGLSVAQVQRMVRAGTLPRVELPGLNDIRIPAAALKLESLKERKALPIHSEAGAGLAKGAAAAGGVAGPAARGRGPRARAAAGPEGRAKWYSTTFPGADSQGVVQPGGACGGNSSGARADSKGGGGGSRGRAPAERSIDQCPEFFGSNG